MRLKKRLRIRPRGGRRTGLNSAHVVRDFVLSDRTAGDTIDDMTLASLVDAVNASGGVAVHLAEKSTDAGVCIGHVCGAKARDGRLTADLHLVAAENEAASKRFAEHVEKLTRATPTAFKLVSVLPYRDDDDDSRRAAYLRRHGLRITPREAKSTPATPAAGGFLDAVREYVRAHGVGLDAAAIQVAIARPALFSAHYKQATKSPGSPAAAKAEWLQK